MPCRILPIFKPPKSHRNSFCHKYTSPGILHWNKKKRNWTLLIIPTNYQQASDLSKLKTQDLKSISKTYHPSFPNLLPVTRHLPSLNTFPEYLNKYPLTYFSLTSNPDHIWESSSHNPFHHPLKWVSKSLPKNSLPFYTSNSSDYPRYLTGPSQKKVHIDTNHCPNSGPVKQKKDHQRE